MLRHLAVLVLAALRPPARQTTEQFFSISCAQK
jgi:hypothetical protein